MTVQKIAFRTREEQVKHLTSRINDMRMDYPEKEMREALEQAEARGAEEQRRKDAEGQEPVGYVAANNSSSELQMRGCYPKASGIYSVPVYPRPANVAALEARVKELEAENIALKTRVINAAENLLSIETPCMKGDNFAVTICSYFEDCEGEPCDSGWHTKATEAYEEIKTAIIRHFRAALTREGGE